MKKTFTRAKLILSYAVSIVLAVALIVGNVFANIYEDLLNVVFSKSDYVTSEKEKELCEDVEGEAIVLLHNKNNALPLSASEKKLAVFGQNSVDFVYGGSGSGSVDTSSAPTLKKALERAGYSVNETLWDFYTTGAGKSYRKAYPNLSGDGDFAVNEVPMSVFTNEVKNSLSDDVAIVTIGRSGGESSDLPLTKMPTGYKYLEIDKNERDTLALACQKFDKVIVIVNSSNALELGFLYEPEYANVQAALWVGAVGQEGMYAIGEVLNGTVNPSGRLVDTYAYDSMSAPSFKNMGDFTVTNSTVRNGNKYTVYQEGIYNGYRYYETRYEDVVYSQGNAGDYDYSKQVQYPFGYGLSYTSFEWSNYVATLSEDGKNVEVSLTVKNTGTVAGKDVVELYVQSPYEDYDKINNVEKPAVSLVGYSKTDVIEAGESVEVKATVSVENFASYDYKGYKTYFLGEGEHYLAAGRDAHDALNNVLAAKGKTVADGMKASAQGVNNAAGDATLAKVVLSLNVADATTYAKSQATGADITNQFDDVDVNYYDEITYLTRNDWMGTMPTSAYKNGSWTGSDKMLADLEFYRGDEVVNALNATMPTMSSKETTHKVQDMTAADYNDEGWNELVERLSYKQVTQLVRMGGYATKQIDAIGLPATIDKDGPSGISGTLVGGASTMAWPAEVVMASTWNDALIEDMGVVIGEQSIGAGVAGWYAPGVNIHRSPYSGRNFEYFSEDGFLSGKIAGAEMKGVRSKGVIAYMKHFALNDQETNRYGALVFSNEQAIREIYLKGFEGAARDGKATAAMASMNRIGTRWTGAHKGLMTNVLRGEWGFKGMVITDQASSPAMFYQDMPSGLWAGTDLWLNTNAMYWSLDEWKDNPTVMTNVHRAAKNIIYSVTNSNAVIDYETGGEVETGTNVYPWKTWVTILNVVVFGGCGLTMLISTCRYVKAKKNRSEKKKR